MHSIETDDCSLQHQRRTLGVRSSDITKGRKIITLCIVCLLFSQKGDQSINKTKVKAIINSTVLHTPHAESCAKSYVRKQQ